MLLCQPFLLCLLMPLIYLYNFKFTFPYIYILFFLIQHIKILLQASAVIILFPFIFQAAIKICKY